MLNYLNSHKILDNEPVLKQQAFRIFFPPPQMGNSLGSSENLVAPIGIPNQN